jgi:hypothetical protein
MQRTLFVSSGVPPIGAKVRVQATLCGKTYWQLREVGGASRQQNDLRQHFGLGDGLFRVNGSPWVTRR